MSQNSNTMHHPEWEMVRQLGFGTCSAVYEIQCRSNPNEHAVLKVITIPYSAKDLSEMYLSGHSTESIHKFYFQQFQAISGLFYEMAHAKDHPNILRYDELTPYPHTDGIGWDIHIRYELLPPISSAVSQVCTESQVIRMATNVCSALSRLYVTGNFHLNIKPQNIFITNTGAFKLGDFGFANATGKITHDTLNFMAPEACNGHFSPQADIYSLGLVMYWLLNNGVLPFLPYFVTAHSFDQEEEARKHRLQGEPLPPPCRGSQSLHAIIAKACAFNPDDRYQSVQEMAAALDALAMLAPTAPQLFSGIHNPSVPLPPHSDQAQHIHIAKKCDTAPKTPPANSKGKSKVLTLAMVCFILAVSLVISVALSRKTSNHDNSYNQDGISETRYISANQGNETQAASSNSSDQAYLDTINYCSKQESTENFSSILAYLDSKILEYPNDTRYRDLLTNYQSKFSTQVLSKANAMAQNGRYLKAMHIIWSAQDIYNCGSFQSALKNYQDMFSFYSVAAGRKHSVLLQKNGTVTAVGSNDDGQLNVTNWRNIVSVCTGDYHTVGLQKNGTVYATGNNEYNQCNVNSWSDVKKISAGDYHTVGLRSDGSLIATGWNTFGQCNVNNLYRNTPIIGVACGYEHTVVLYADGTAGAIGQNNKGQCNVSGWTNLVAIYAGTEHTVGLRSDGTVVATGSNEYGQCSVSGWRGITNLSAGDYFVLGLKEDGSVVATGHNTSGECNVGTWSNITAIAGGCHHSIAVSTNGDVWAVGENKYNQCDTYGLK